MSRSLCYRWPRTRSTAPTSRRSQRLRKSTTDATTAIGLLLADSRCCNNVGSATVSLSTHPPLSRIMRMNHQSPISTSPRHTQYPLSTLHPQRTPHNPSNIARV
jgi:hypothetical protein